MVVLKREPAVERVIDFVSKFAPSLNQKSSEKEDGDMDDDVDSVADNKLLQAMFDFLLDVSSSLV